VPDNHPLSTHRFFTGAHQPSSRSILQTGQYISSSACMLHSCHPPKTPEAVHRQFQSEGLLRSSMLPELQSLILLRSSFTSLITPPELRPELASSFRASNPDTPELILFFHFITGAAKASNKACQKNWCTLLVQ
jgi:hypothetical protein